MFGKKGTGIRAKLYFLVICALLPALGIILYSGNLERRREIAKMTDDTRLIVNSLAAQQITLAESTRQMLVTLAHIPEVSARDAAACQNILALIHKDNPVYTNILISDTGGEVFASAMPLEKHINIKDRKHFQDAMTSGDFTVGEYIVSRSTGEAALPFAYPVTNAQGKIVAVLIAAVRQDSFMDYLAKAEIQPSGVVGILDWKCVRLLRFPELDVADVGMRVPDNLIPHLTGAADEGRFTGIDVTGRERVFSFKRLRLRPGQPPYLYLLASMREEEALAEANRVLYRNVVLLLAVAGVSLFIAHLIGEATILSHVQTLVEASRRLGRGELGARAGLDALGGEIGELAGAFDDMAGSLEARVAEAGRISQELRESRERYQTIFDKVSDSLIILSQDGRIVETNETARDMYGYSGDAMLGLPGRELVLPERRVEFDLFLKRMKQGGGVEGESVNVRRDGAPFMVDFRGVPCQFRGEPHILAVVRDITARKAAEERFVALNRCFLEFGPDSGENIASLSRLCGLQLNADATLYLVLRDGDMVVSSGWNLPENLPQSFPAQGSVCLDILNKGLDEPVHLANLLQSPYAQSNPLIPSFGVDTCLGQVVKLARQPVGVLCVVYRNSFEPSEADQRFMSILALAVGVEEERRRTLETITASLHEKEILLKEIHHRVKNNLQIVSSLLNLQTHYIDDERAIDPLIESRNRVMSMAMVHEELYRSRNLAGIDLVAYLRKLLERIANSYASGKNVEISVLGDSLVFGIDRAIPLGLLVNELATNSFKHGFKDRTSGHIEVEISLSDGRMLLRVSDDGVGLPPNLDFRQVQTLGMQLVASLVQQLNGRLDKPDDGRTTFVVDFPA